MERLLNLSNEECHALIRGGNGFKYREKLEEDWKKNYKIYGKDWDSVTNDLPYGEWILEEWSCYFDYCAAAHPPLVVTL
jgi:hypothetical protein